MLVDRGFVKDSLITEIPASTYLCIYCNGFEREKEYMGRLVEEIRTKEYQVTGDYICEVVAEVPMDMQERGMFCAFRCRYLSGKITLDLIPCISFILLTEANNT